MPLHFAYGSNMDRAAMRSRCPGSRPVGLARLARHRFIITQDGYASVLRDPRGTVWGVLWDVPFADMAALDRYEGIATGLYAKLSQPVLTAAGPRRALVYVGRGTEPDRPRPGYLEAVIAAAREAQLPSSYVRELEAWRPRPGPARAAGAAARASSASPVMRDTAARPEPWRWEP